MFSCQAHYFGIFLIVCVFWNNNVNCNAIDPEDEERAVTIEVLTFNSTQLPYGENVTIICKSKWVDSFILWTFDERNITDGENGFKLEMESENINTKSGKKSEVSILHIVNIDLKHVGDYKCHSTHKLELALDFCKITLNVTLPAQIVQISPPIHTKLHQNIDLYCVIKGYPIEDIKWFKDDELLPSDLWTVKTINETLKNTTLTVSEVTKKDNATYTCLASNGHNTVNSSSAILVLDKPQITIDFVKAIGINKVYLNWTVNDGNDPKHLKYTIQYMLSGDSNWIFFQNKIDEKARSYVLKDIFKNNTECTIRIKAKNSEGESQYSTSTPVRMLSEDPVFIPEVKVTGVTVSSITISWSTPTDDLKDHVQYYTLYLKTNNSSFNAIHPVSKENYHMFSELDPATNYNFQVAACSEYSQTCGPPSDVVNGTTMDGISGPPSNPTIQCRFDNISQISFVHITWQAPIKPHGMILYYHVHLEGSATFINDQGVVEHTTWGPKLKSVSENTFNTRFNNVSANTNYTVKICGVTRTKKNGETVSLQCTMPSMLPDKQKLAQLNWTKIEEQGRWLFQLHIPRVSERNGPICCYRIYLVRMEDQQKIAELPSPEDLSIVSYQEAHRTPKGGAYVAEMFTSSAFHGEVFLGDEQVYNLSNTQCDECVGLRPYTSYKELKFDNSNDTANRVKREERYDPLPPHDGTLDINSNYTGFIEVVVYGNSTRASTIAAYSNYLIMMNPGPENAEVPRTATLGTLNLVVQILCGIVMLVLLLLGALCILHHYTKQAHAQAVEITFRTSLRSLRGRQRLVSLNPPDMCPISKGELVSAYIERHRDSDYGFQQEFELLPDRFSDRTTRSSDARENVYKNRYPDIKAYDQTRVKVSQIDSIAGSDYINANYVLGYKERKKFICAQGPMDTTVNDFWRMIWEQHLELILMLTNLEEYSKTKCAKYWPDKCDGDKSFGDITVTHVQETRYSDYIVRELRICRNAPGKDKEERQITQYHYLVWKDFMAPEHPNGIIKFIKRVNEAYSIEKGCILIHCSAGVGRTGTLVALDCLLQQLKEEEHVSIFNTICDLRHQRNFLVQSLKQYIFIYRALMEVAQYGDTEIATSKLKTTVDKLRQCDKDKAKCKLEEEFENILNAFEDRKSCSVAKGDENREKNRSDVVIPYDRNRVILTPLSGKEHSTYINASFIEGYDNTESFIITQDPTESTINDFWRMISEQGISVIVMLSELGENKCPRYWPDEDENTYDQIHVRYEQAESCPYYTRREMFVKGRDCEEHRVMHLQYHGWPTVDGEVPEVTRGLIELVDHAQSNLVHNDCSPSMVVHCNLGSDRSSMFVGLSILVQQLRTEKRVDVFTVTRKLRSQRNGLISTYAQYEFLHRAIVNYAELHGLCDS
ncbi:tyrosine-protein phosphatase 69D isoform X2 [Zophobas morio]|uniref:tyrosine-protein phosphatase 69D isoform X2 n=1 Tax=Zophobas morio TaxID=2755281 RepID=UPI00308334DE